MGETSKGLTMHHTAAEAGQGRPVPSTAARHIVSAIRRATPDIHLGRAWTFDPRFRFLREPGSVEVIAFGWMLVVSRRAPV